MATTDYHLERTGAYRSASTFSAVRWGAVFAGTVAGIALYLLMTLFGVAAGLAAVDPQAGQPGGGVSIWAGIWAFISMITAAFVGGWVAGRMSGLRRRVDGMLHGFVAWGLTTLLALFVGSAATAGVLGGLGQNLPGGQQVMTVATAATWGVFIAFLISLLLGIAGGALGTRGTSKRAIGDHSGERHYTAA